MHCFPQGPALSVLRTAVPTVPGGQSAEALPPTNCILVQDTSQGAEAPPTFRPERPRLSLCPHKALTELYNPHLLSFCFAGPVLLSHPFHLLKPGPFHMPLPTGVPHI